MKKVKMMSCALATGFMMFTTLAPNAYAEKNNNIQVQIDEANGSLQSQQQQRQQLQKEMDELKKTIKELEASITATQEKLDKTKQDITETQRIINEKVEKIAQLEKQIEQREYIIKQRLVAMQDQPRVNIVTEVLVNSQSVLDLMDRINSLSLIFESDTNILEAQERDQNQVEAEKEAILQKQAELRAYEQELTKTHNELIADQQKKQEALDQMEEKMQTIVNTMTSTESQLRQLERQALFLQQQAEEDDSANTTQAIAASSSSTPAPAPAAKPAVTAPPTSNSGVVSYAMQFLGRPYVFGAAGPNAFDCSGFISFVYKVGRQDVAGYWASVQKTGNPQPGDLVFFANTYKPGPSHMGIYIGNNKMIHAGSKGIAISDLGSSYNRKHFLGYGKGF
jgi:cell wall-associated NlpC family hydrolase/F0F1-type ATP synthase membrane subunit b/b'